MVLLIVLTILYLWNQFLRQEIAKWIYQINWMAIFTLYLFLFTYNAIFNQRIPLANFPEAFYFALFCMLITVAVIEIRLKEKSFAMFVLPFLSLLSFIGVLLRNSDRILPVEMRTLYWPFHVAFAIVSYSFFFIAFATAISYIVKHYQIKKKIFPLNFLTNIPALELIEKYLQVYSQLGFFFLTFGLFIGALWANQLKLSISDTLIPKAIFSFLTWFYYLLFLIFRNKAKLFGIKQAIFITIGFLFVILTFSIGNHAF